MLLEKLNPFPRIRNLADLLARSELEYKDPFGLEIKTSNIRIPYESLFNEESISELFRLTYHNGLLIIRNVSRPQKAGPLLSYTRKKKLSVKYWNGLTYRKEIFAKVKSASEAVATYNWHQDSLDKERLMCFYKRGGSPTASGTDFTKSLDAIPYVYEQISALREMLDKQLGEPRFNENAINNYDSLSEYLEHLRKNVLNKRPCCYTHKQTEKNSRVLHEASALVLEGLSCNETSLMEKVKLITLFSLIKAPNPDFELDYVHALNSKFSDNSYYSHRWRDRDLIIAPTCPMYMHKKRMNPTPQNEGELHATTLELCDNMN